ncbi:MAG: hypothetical protein QUV05_12290 [Phycisphaerae bacterium]|nr:hypothetical protein [Phycisphaerae bacterium]
MRCRTAGLLLVTMVAATAQASVIFGDDFEPSGIDGSIWLKWPEAKERFFSDDGRNHTDTPEATWSARAEEADPWGYAIYADFGATTGPVYAEVWVWDEMDDTGLDYDRPVSNMLAVIGAAAEPVEYTDYLQLGVVAWYDPAGLSDTYCTRTRYRDEASAGFVDTLFPRRQGWMKLAIAAESLADGGRVRFFVDDQVVDIAYRKPGVALQYIRLGVNFKSYDPFWYDDVLVTDVLPVDDFVRFDVDDDGDVDQADFGRFQDCMTTPGDRYVRADCWRMDADDDQDVDRDDHDRFEQCGSGPGISAAPQCDD